MNQSIYRHDFTAHSEHIDLGDRFWVDKTPILQAFCQVLPSRMADLVEVAMAAYTADRLSLRRFKGVATGQRQLHIRVAVREPDLWGSGAVISGLQEFLNWISGDDWSFDFIERNGVPMQTESEPFLFGLPYEQPLNVSLFSGGLDSLAGLAGHALKRPLASCILVSGYTNNRLFHQQRSQVKRIFEVLDQLPVNKRLELRHVAVPFGVCKISNEREEKSQRTRAFVFFALGSVTALLAKSDTLWVYENGIGALNLPLNETQLGVDNYRGVHPRSLMIASSLFEEILEQTIHIKNPYLFTTKAKMCQALAPAGLAQAIRDTVSCDSFPIRESGRPQCGFCPSCSLRRMSIQAAGLSRFDPVNGYRHDVLNVEPTLNKNQLYELSTTDYQVAKFKNCLASEDPWKSLTSAFPKLAVTCAELVVREGLASSDVVNDFLELFQTYVREWEAYPANISISAE